MKGNTMYANDYGQPARLADLIRSAPMTADSERADWTGATAKAQFQGAAQADRHAVLGVTFGKRRRFF